MRDIVMIANDFEAALVGNDRETARHLIIDALSGMSVLDRVESIINPTLAHIGEKWEAGTLSLSHVYLSAKLSEEIVTDIMRGSNLHRIDRPKIAAVCLEDYHLLGLRVVRMAIQSSGYDVIDYGRMDVDSLVEKVCHDKVEYLLVSTLMLRSALKVKQLAELLQARDCPVCIIVGGAPFRFDLALWKNVDANFTTSSPLEALEFILSREGSR